MGKIKLTECNQELVRGELDRLGLEVGGIKDDQVERLRLYYEENQNRFEIAGCDVCDGDSDAELDACPFCGETGVMDDGIPVDMGKADSDPAPEGNEAPTSSTEADAVSAEVDDDWITVSQAAAEVGATVATIYLWIRSGKIDAVGRPRMIDRLTLLRYLEIRRTKKSKNARAEVLESTKNEEGTTALSKRAEALQGDRAPDDPPLPEKAVKLMVPMGIQKVPLYKRPKGKSSKVCDPETAEQATSISEHPWLMLELRNKVRLSVRLEQAKDGHLQASVEFSRGEPAI